MDQFPKTEHGYFHLTAHGWIRRDHEPFPNDRIETWAYQMTCPNTDAKEQVFLIRTWIKPGTTAKRRAEYHAQFGEPLMASPERNVILECHV